MKHDNIATSCRTISDLLAVRCAASPEASAFFTLDEKKCWQAISWKQYFKNVMRVCAALKHFEIRKGDCVGIMAPTSLNWEYAQMGALAAGTTVAGIDQTYPADQLEHIFNRLDLSALFVQDREILNKIPISFLKRVKLIIIFEGSPQQAFEHSMDEILTSNNIPENVKNYNEAKPEDVAVIVFSSGTTGFPKVITFSHEQVLIAVDAILDVFNDIEERTVFLCWMPLANLFQRVINFFAINRGVSSYILNDPRDLMNYVGDVNPHILIGVPRVLERVHEEVMGRIEKKMWITRNLIHWALRIGYKKALIRSSSSEPGLIDTVLWCLADKIILRRLRMVFGSQIRYFVCGSSAMPLWLLEWYEAISLPIVEAYGVSENIIPNAINHFSTRKLGTVGKPLIPNQIILASDKEVLVRGPGVFHGYLGNLSENGLKRFTVDGYWHTGDLGHIDDDGFLSLTGRKTEAFKTPGGKWVMPTQIEAQLRRVSYIEQGVVFLLSSGKVAAILSVDKLKYPAGNERSERIQTDLETVLKILPVYQHPIGFIVTFKQFSISSGELTSNLKLRRRIIIDNFSTYFEPLEDEIMKMLKHNRSVNNKIFFKPIITFI